MTGSAPRPIVFDEFAASYSLAGCTPALPASASPAGYYLASASRFCKPPPRGGWGIFDRYNGEFSTGLDSARAGGHGGGDVATGNDCEDSRSAVKADAGRAAQIGPQNPDGRSQDAEGRPRFHKWAQTYG